MSNRRRWPAVRAILCNDDCGGKTACARKQQGEKPHRPILHGTLRNQQGMLQDGLVEFLPGSLLFELGALCQFFVLLGFSAKLRVMPKVIGILLSIDGVGWMMFVYPPLGSSLFTFIAIAAGLAEIPLLLWLLIMGVNPQRWNDQAAAAGITSSA